MCATNATSLAISTDISTIVNAAAAARITMEAIFEGSKFAKAAAVIVALRFGISERFE
jgi:hypothetical protein